MKLALVIIGLVVVTSADDMQTPPAYDEKEFILKQKAILELIWRVGQPTYFSSIQEIGNTYNIQDNLDKFTNVEVVNKFYNTYKYGMLPQGEIFSPINEEHLKEAIQLYDLFYSAKDWDTFYNVACWARVHINSGQFYYTLIIAIMHREDTQDIILPPPYEIYPNLFFDRAVIQQALQARVMNNNEQKEYVILVNNTYTYPQYLYENLRHLPEEQRMLSIKYKYGEDYKKNLHLDARLSYFTEDIGINTWYSLFHLQNPSWLNQTNVNKKTRRGEKFYYVHQQLLARYNLERLSNDLKEIDVLMWDQPIEVGYAPNLQYPNGQEFPVRQDNVIPTEVRTYETELVQHLERRILDAIDLGYLLTQDGKKISLYDQTNKVQDQGIEYLGQLIQSTADSVNPHYFGNLYQLSLRIVGHIFDARHQHDVAYGTLEQQMTALRDPVFYRLINRMNQLFIRYKMNLPKYQRQELIYPGVKITWVHVGKLVTYFDQCDPVDISAAIRVNNFEEDKNLRVVARRLNRLNHHKFSFKIQVDSDKKQHVIVRAFIGPKYDAEGRVLNINQKRLQMVEIDRFTDYIQNGTNIIYQYSSSNVHVSSPRHETRALYYYLMASLDKEELFMYEKDWRMYGFPDNLLLPKGKKDGMPFTFFVTITPRGQHKQQEIVGDGINTVFEQDELPLGYPFDRVIDVNEFDVPNFYEKDVTIFYESYENFYDHDWVTASSSLSSCFFFSSPGGVLFTFYLYLLLNHCLP